MPINVFSGITGIARQVGAATATRERLVDLGHGGVGLQETPTTLNRHIGLKDLQNGCI